MQGVNVDKLGLYSPTERAGRTERGTERQRKGQRKKKEGKRGVPAKNEAKKGVREVRCLIAK